jgi:hypothetical protein
MFGGGRHEQNTFPKYKIQCGLEDDLENATGDDLRLRGWAVFRDAHVAIHVTVAVASSNCLRVAACWKAKNVGAVGISQSHELSNYE